MKGCTAKQYLDAKRAREPSIQKSVDLWEARFAGPVDQAQAERVRIRVAELVAAKKNRKDLAPDGRPYDDGVRFHQTKARGNQ